jgi:hypothetical protein
MSYRPMVHSTYTVRAEDAPARTLSLIRAILPYVIAQDGIDVVPGDSNGWHHFGKTPPQTVIEKVETIIHTVVSISTNGKGA